MSRRLRLSVFLAVVTVVVCGVTAFAVAAARDYRREHDRPPTVATVSDDTARHAVLTGPRIVFRHTGIDDHYGLVAAVPLAEPGGPRVFTDVACDRVDATARAASCLRTDRGVVTRYELLELDTSWHRTGSAQVPGIPSRTRLSPDGSLVASTTFVGGHSYMQVGFSTATEIREVGGSSLGNLESFTLVIDGETVAPRDRNLWGVTFATDDRTFFATVGTGGRTYLVRGDLERRTLTSIRENAECPSLSPDGTRVGYKVDVGTDHTWWTPAVLDLRTGRQTLLRGERRNVDDQVEWLDGDTLLYGVPREKQTGVTDVWALDTRADAEPVRLIEQAWSPAVVRP
jgi:hypothetical protein